MVNTCVSTYTGHMSAVSIFSLANPILFGGLLLIRMKISYSENFDIAPKAHQQLPKSPSFGVGAIAILKMITGIGIAESFAQTLLFYVFYFSPDSNSQEFACQCESGFIGVAFPFLFLYFVYAILVTNYLREHWTRFKFAKDSSEYLRPAPGNHKHATISVIPAYRGCWVAPVVNQFVKNARSDQTVEALCLDAYGTKYNPEDDQWLKANMRIEGIDQYVSSVWTDFVKLPLKDNSVDCVVMPTGSVMTYLKEGDTPEAKALILKNYLSEVLRVLRPGGWFVSSSLTIACKTFLDGIQETGFSEVQQVPGILMWSFMPAKITVARKPLTVVAALSCDVDKQGTVADHIEVGNTTTVVVDDQADGSAIDTATQQSDLIKSAELVYYGWFPSGWHWRMVEWLMMFTVLLWAVFVWISWFWLDVMQVPSYLAYSEMISALFISNALALPFVFYLILGRLREVAIATEKQMRADIKTTTQPSETLSDIERGNKAGEAVTSASARSQAEWERKYSRLARKRIWRSFLGEMFDVFLLLTVNSVLTWLPYFPLDILMIRVGHLSFLVVNNANTVASIVVTVLLVMFGGRIMAWYSSVKKLQEESEDALAASERLIAKHEEEAVGSDYQLDTRDDAPNNKPQSSSARIQSTELSRNVTKNPLNSPQLS